MARYATERSFGGQRASVGRIVLLACASHDDPKKTCLRAGIIIAISSKHDRPYIHDLKTGEADFLWEVPWKYYDPESRTEETRLTEIETCMPIGSWTWPPRVS